MATKKIALFIDADNISAKFGKQIIDTLESRGEIFIRRIYGNWEKISLHGWNECILNFSLRAVQQPDFVSGKNATDMSLTIDAMDVLYGGKAEVFALASNDSDFTPLVIRLREGGMKIIGMGNGNASNSFRMSCDEFIDFDAPAEVKLPQGSPKVGRKFSTTYSPVQLNLFTEENIELKPAVQVKPEVSTSLQVQHAQNISPVAVNPKVVSISENQLQSEQDKKIQQIHDVLREAAEIHIDNSGFLLLTLAGAELKNKNLGFTVRDFGYNQLKDFVSAFPMLYEIKANDKTVYYRCLTIDKLQPIHDVLREVAKTYGDEKGFVNLGQAGSAIKQKNVNIKDSGYAKLGKFISAFPSLYEVRNNSYRCR